MGAKTVKIVQLYPDEMNLYGDNGNLLCLKKRLFARGIKYTFSKIGIGEPLPCFDILFIGGGQDKEMKTIAADIRKKSDALSYYIQQCKTVLAICGGYQILGEYYLTADGEKMRLAGVLPFYTVSGAKRLVGNIVYKTKFGKTVGFENHAGKTYLSKEIEPLGEVITGNGNNGEDKTEGARYKNTFCTYAHGPVLPKNPLFADEIIRCALKTKALQPIDDKLENMCHDSLINRFGR